MCVVKSEDGSTEQIATCSADNKRNSCPPECECPSSPWLPGIHLKLEAFYCCKKKKSGYGSYNKYGNKYNGGQ
nr:N-U6 [Pinctada fucata]